MAATRRPTLLAAAVATAVAVGATAFVLPAVAAGSPAAAPAAAPELELVDGKLEWGIKKSFRSYITSPVAQGRITVEGDVRQADGNGVFTFSGGKGSYDTSTHHSVTAFTGGVRFEGHHGALDVRLSDIKIGTGRQSGTITADFTTKKQDGTTVSEDDAPIAALDIAGAQRGGGADGAMVFTDIPATLTAAGSAAFAGFYAEGAALDPATLSVKVGRPGPDPEPSATPSEKPSTGPSATPSEKPSTGPSATPSEKPSTGPSATPSEKPSTGPSATPSEKPSTGPSATPGEKPSTGPSPSGSSTARPVSGPVVDGNLDWGVKQKFRDYVLGPIAGGKVETSGGASAADGGYRFTGATGHLDADTDTLSAAFRGTVRFLGHRKGGSYELDLSLSNVKVDVKGTSGRLVADVASKARPTDAEPNPPVNKVTGVAFAEFKVPAGGLDAQDGVVALKGLPATLTEDGSQAFSGMYRKGEELDALDVAVSLDKDALLPGGSAGGSGTSGGPAGGSGTSGGTAAGGSTGGGGTVGGGSVGGSGSLASTGSDLPAGALIAASGVVLAAGTGVVVAARRRRAAGA